MDLNYKFRYTESALRDLDNILAYLEEYKDPLILTNFKHQIDYELDLIKTFPYLSGVIFRQHGYEYRKLIIKNYIFVYYVDEISREIVIFRIFHELEDYQNKLGYK